MTYEEKLAYANNYLVGIAGIGWNDLADINSLHDADDEDGIRELCDERLSEAGYPGDDEGVSGDET